jgi:D-sedoheptulose 7-phosphate isomerase
MMDSLIESAFSEHVAVANKTLAALGGDIAKAADIVSRAMKNDGMLLLCGNGGSASDCQHISAELVGRYKKDRRPLRAVSLHTDTSSLTCIANDFGYEDIFTRQVEALGRKGDVLLAISTSGNSENVRRAMAKAKELGITVIALLGKEGGPCAPLAELALIVPSNTTARIQEMHIMIGHLICEMVEHDLGLD